jgi:predicted transcriptional regulator
MMYGTNMPWDALNRIKEPLISQGLLSEVEVSGSKRTKSKYLVTKKGEMFREYLGLAMNPGILEEEIPT